MKQVFKYSSGEIEIYNSGTNKTILLATWTDHAEHNPCYIVADKDGRVAAAVIDRERYDKYYVDYIDIECESCRKRAIAEFDQYWIDKSAIKIEGSKYVLIQIVDDVEAWLMEAAG